MQNLWPVLIVLACPVMMIFMMRGMGAGHSTTSSPPPADQADHARDERIATLERELAELRSQSEPSAHDRSASPPSLGGRR